MARVPLQITRRELLRSGAVAGAAAGAVGLGATPARADDRTAWYRRGEVRTTYNVCDICPWSCGVIVRSVDGVVQKIDGNPIDPKSRGKLCPRGQGGPSFVNDPDRLRAPMVRTGERGEGRFREVEWDFALDLIAQRMAAIRDRSGPEAVAIAGHTSGDKWWIEHFAQAWGTPNAANPASAMCIAPRDEASNLTFGFPVGGHEPLDWPNLECLTLMGSHIGEDTRNTVMQDFAGIHGRGGRIIVIDPRFSSAATKADLWLPIRPGTDTALMLAILHVIIGEDRYDRAYVERWTTGFEELAAHVREYSPEWAAPITDLPADRIRAAAHMMADHAPRSVIMPGRHTTWYGNDTQRMRTTYLINAVLGAYGREGGLYFNRSPYIQDFPHPPYQVEGSAGGCSAEPEEDTGEGPAPLPVGPSGKARADGARERFLRGPTALQELIEPMITGEPYRIEGLIAYGVNMLNSIPMPERTIEAFKALDLFVAIDVLPQEHIAWADIVLPEASYLERYDQLLTMAHRRPYIALREPAIEPMHDTRPGWWMARELGIRLDLEKYYRWETIEEYLDTRLRSVGSSIEDLRARGGIITQDGRPFLEDFEGSTPFATSTGRIELFSHTLQAGGLDPLPVYEPTEQPPDGYFRLLYGRDPVHTFAKTQNTPVLNEVVDENELWLNADVAAELGIADGQRVMVENREGTRTGPIRVKATQRIRRDAVFMSHGWGSDAPGLTRANGRGASDNKLMARYALDPVCGSAGMRVNFVRIDPEV